MISSTPKDGIYFEGDTGMAAEALIEMFGDDATAQVNGRIKDMKREKDAEGIRFWQEVADKIAQRIAGRQ